MTAVFYDRHGVGSSKVLASASGAASIDGSFLPCLRRAVVAYSDASVRIWELRGEVPKISHTVQLDSHPQLSDVSPHDKNGATGSEVSETSVGGINCLACHQRLELVSVASDAGHVVLLNTSRGVVAHVFDTARIGGFQSDARGIECLSFSPPPSNVNPNAPSFLAAGTLDGCILMFNYSSFVVVHTMQCVDASVSEGRGGTSVVGLRWNSTGSQLYSADRQGKVIVKHCWHQLGILFYVFVFV